MSMINGAALEKGCTPEGRRAASMAEMRGDGGPPDGHDPEALRAAPLLAKSMWGPLCSC